MIPLELEEEDEPDDSQVKGWLGVGGPPSGGSWPLYSLADRLEMLSSEQPFLLLMPSNPASKGFDEFQALKLELKVADLVKQRLRPQIMGSIMGFKLLKAEHVPKLKPLLSKADHYTEDGTTPYLALLSTRAVLPHPTRGSKESVLWWPVQLGMTVEKLEAEYILGLFAKYAKFQELVQMK